MTDFTLTSAVPVTFENLEWDLTPPHGRVVGGGTLAVASLNAAAHYPNGYVSSGLIVALATGGTFVNQLVPWVSAGANGAGTAVGVLVASVPVTRASGATARAKIGVAFMQRGVVSFGKLPYTAAGVGANGGALTDIATARTQLPAIIWQV
jgi:hypothetical protein